MWWICVVLLVGLPLSSQDLVTLAPSEAGSETAAPSESGDTSALQAGGLKPSIRSLQVTSHIKYRYATTVVSSRVVNPSNQSGEAAFTLTLPESAFISQFLMDVKGKVYKAYVKEKEEAKTQYNAAVQAGQFAGHVALDARDSNQFTVSVNIEAHGKVTFNLTYEQLLSRNLDVYSNVININPQQIVEDMSVSVEIEEPSAIKGLEVPEIQISNDVIEKETKPNALARIEEKSASHKVVVWAPTPEQQKALNSTGVSGQFIVRYDVDRSQNPQQILVDEGYFVHFFAPTDLARLRKHVVFVLDYSGSMAGHKLEQLKQAMDKIISDLSDKDYFSLVIFQSIVEVWSPDKHFKPSETPMWDDPVTPQNVTLGRESVVKASSTNIALARSYLANYSDLGATNIMGGLRTGLKLVQLGSDMLANESESPQPIMVFLTDGQPNVEVYNTDEILTKTKPLNTKGCPIFSLAFGYDADLDFLRKLSLSNSGFARTIYEAADAAQQLEKFYKTIASPVLANVTFNYLPGQVNESSHTKVDFPVFFDGSELVVSGKVDRARVCAVESKEDATFGELVAVNADGTKKYPIVVNCLVLPNLDRSGASHLEKTWAYLNIQQLLDKADSLDQGADKNQTQEKALKLALQYSFVTPLTSLVVVKPNETESSVDTTKVKPGLDNNNYMGLVPLMGVSPVSGISSAGFLPTHMAAGLGSPASYNGPSLPGMMKAPVPSSYQMKIHTGTWVHDDHVDTLAIEEDEVLSTTIHTPQTTEHAARKVALSDIKWLQPYLTNSSNTGNITVHLADGSQAVLALHASDASFGSCNVNGVTGQCQHLKFCPLDVFQDDGFLFNPYQCPIPGSFLGVCCPLSVS